MQQTQRTFAQAILLRTCFGEVANLLQICYIAGVMDVGFYRKCAVLVSFLATTEQQIRWFSSDIARSINLLTYS